MLNQYSLLSNDTSNIMFDTKVHVHVTTTTRRWYTNKKKFHAKVLTAFNRWHTVFNIRTQHPTTKDANII